MASNLKVDWNLVFCVAALAKVLVWGIAAADAAGIVAVLASIHAKATTDYFFPKRPDLFKEIEALKSALQRIDPLERDITALKMRDLKR